MKNHKERLSDVLGSLIDELEQRTDLSEVPIKDLINSIVNTAKLIQTVEDSNAEDNSIIKAITSLKKK